MAADPPRAHWQHVHGTQAATEQSWYQATPRVSLELIAASRIPLDAPLVDVGAGASTLVDFLLKRGHTDVFLLDVADVAFAATRRRLAGRDAGVQYVVADVGKWRPPHGFALWHDRALFHFMSDAAQRDAYLATLRAVLSVGSRAIIATFAPDGPETCSGLPVRRYSAEALATELGGALRLVESRREVHRTPGGGKQTFTYGLFERV